MRRFTDTLNEKLAYVFVMITWNMGAGIDRKTISGLIYIM